MKMILISEGKISSTEIFYCKKGSLHGFYRKCSSNGQLEGNFLFILLLEKTIKLLFPL